MQNVIYNNPAYQANVTAFLEMRKKHAAELQEKLDRCYQKVAARNEAEMDRFRKAVGPVKDFQGVITQF